MSALKETTGLLSLTESQGAMRAFDEARKANEQLLEWISAQTRGLFKGEGWSPYVRALMRNAISEMEPGLKNRPRLIPRVENWTAEEVLNEAGKTARLWVAASEAGNRLGSAFPGIGAEHAAAEYVRQVKENIQAFKTLKGYEGPTPITVEAAQQHVAKERERERETKAMDWRPWAVVGGGVLLTVVIVAITAKGLE